MPSKHIIQGCFQDSFGLLIKAKCLIELIAAVGHQESNSQFYFVKNYTALKGVDVFEKLQGFDASRIYFRSSGGIFFVCWYLLE